MYKSACEAIRLLYSLSSYFAQFFLHKLKPCQAIVRKIELKSSAWQVQNVIQIIVIYFKLVGVNVLMKAHPIVIERKRERIFIYSLHVIQFSNMTAACMYKVYTVELYIRSKKVDRYF